jgi:hypothetical protein
VAPCTCAMFEWARQRRRRDQGKAFERDKVIAALRAMYAEMREPIDPQVSPGLAVTESGIYDLESATDDDVARFGEDLYQQERRK